MCVWCERYADGHRRWYLNPDNYGRHLYKIRRESQERGTFVLGQQTDAGSMGGLVGRQLLETIAIGDEGEYRRIKQAAEDDSAANHFAQAITVEEAMEVMDLVWPIGFQQCACRRSALGRDLEENYVCMSFGVGLYKWKRNPNSYPGGFNFVTSKEAKDILWRMYKAGLMHQIAVFGTPYIASICNCAYPECVFIRDAIDYGLHLLWKGHEIAVVDESLCNGCGLCPAYCNFKALTFAHNRQLPVIDPFRCYGCGVCRAPCKPNALRMVERAEFPSLANTW
jgi:Pyruvate/2-oxoacid:ferredoxin oxidoreductase delta subunit